MPNHLRSAVILPSTMLNLTNLLLCLSLLLVGTFAAATEGKPKTGKIFTIDAHGTLSANFPLAITAYHIPLPVYNLPFAYPVSLGDPLFSARAIDGPFTYKAAFKGAVVGFHVPIGQIIKPGTPIFEVRLEGMLYPDTPAGIEEDDYSTSFEPSGGYKLNDMLKDLVYNEILYTQD